MPDTSLPLSPPEVAYDLLSRHGATEGAAVPDSDPASTVTLIVGPVDHDQAQGGVVSFMGAGLPFVSKYTPILWHRAQIRCVAGDLATADWLAACVQRDLHQLGRKKVYQASNDSWYLIHLCNITAGPSMHHSDHATWETLLFAEMMIGEQKISTGAAEPA